ncbi:unnamed protein product [Protopolystoma xenopodis]|uniref:Uncharacterized protein n=1 Tax=Protopolystoma xenopodis TaxID=117903 RepID=A0A448WPV1_9PLAT|nr:unnamed protein product [Protopolystoma xenopodis]
MSNQDQHPLERGVSALPKGVNNRANFHLVAWHCQSQDLRAGLYGSNRLGLSSRMDQLHEFLWLTMDLSGLAIREHWFCSYNPSRDQHCRK